jgi:thymidylate synthase (FAD)
MKATYIDHMGTDLSVVNAARVSFGKTSAWEKDWDYEEKRPVLSSADKSLIAFLARGCTSGDWESIVWDVMDERDNYDWGDVEPLHDLLNHIRKMPPHWTPFAHTAISIHLKMPIFVARQIMKHTTGIVYNEVSRRYVDDEPEFFVPDVWRERAGNVKQGSGNTEVTFLRMQGFGEQSVVDGCFKHQMHSLDLYRDMLSAGVAPEQARMVLPQSMYTEVIMTGNLFSLANLYVQRTDSHAQKETQDLAKQIGEIIQPLFPVSWEALTA